MDLAMAGKAYGYAVLKVIEPLPDPASLVMDLCTELPAELAA